MHELLYHGMVSLRTAASVLGLVAVLLAAQQILSMGAQSSVTSPRLFIVTYIGLFVLVVGATVFVLWPWLRGGHHGT
jgi:hypothetical protein